MKRFANNETIGTLSQVGAVLCGGNEKNKKKISKAVTRENVDFLSSVSLSKGLGQVIPLSREEYVERKGFSFCSDIDKDFVLEVTPYLRKLNLDGDVESIKISDKRMCPVSKYVFMSTRPLLTGEGQEGVNLVSAVRESRFLKYLKGVLGEESSFNSITMDTDLSQDAKVYVKCVNYHNNHYTYDILIL